MSQKIKTDLAVDGSVTATSFIGGNVSNWNTAYTYSQVGHLPLTGGQLTGTLKVGTTAGTWGSTFIGTSSTAGWGTGAYPFIGSNGGSVGSLIMLHNPHIPFRTDNAISASYDGRAGIRCAIDEAGTAYWDIGLAGDFFHIYRGGTGEFFRVANNGNVTATGTITAPTFSGALSGNASSASNAALLDSLDSTQFLRSDESDVMTGNLNVVTAGNASKGTIMISGSKTDGANKYSSIAVEQFASTAEPEGFAAIVAYSTAGANELNIGGNVWELNAATSINFFTYSSPITPINNGGTFAMTIDSSQRVGVGLTSPEHRLHVKDFSAEVSIAVESTGANPSRLRLINADRTFMITNNPGDDLLSILYDTGNRLQFDLTDQWFNSGFLGIGTADPVNTLHVYNTAAADAMRIESTQTFSTLAFKSSTNTETAVFGVDGGGSAYIEQKKPNSPIFFTTNTTQRLYIAGGGNVGIGMNVPNQKLQVAGNIALGSTTLGYQESGSKFIGTSQSTMGTDGFTGIQIESVNAPAPYDGNYSQNIKFFTHHYAAGTGGTPRVTIQYDGKVGIGTVTPSGTYGKLSVAGGIRILDDNNAKLEIGRYSSGASNSYIKLGSLSNALSITNNTDSIDIFTVVNDGNVGIGTNSPSPHNGGNSLIVKGNANLADKRGILEIHDGNTSGKAVFQQVGATTYIGNLGGNGDVAMLVNGVGNNADVSAYFKANGNVGINTTNPTQLLHLYKSSGSLAISLQSGSNYAYLFNDATNIGLGSNVGVTGLKLLVDRNAPDNSFIINLSGNIGINTTSIDASTPKLDVNGSIMSKGTSIIAAPTSDAIVIDYFSPSNAARIMAGGSGLWNKNIALNPYGGLVGIGTTNPKSMLHVAQSGNVNGGSLLLGPGGSGTTKWSYLAGAHYNQDTGSGNGSGSAGIALIGSFSTLTENKVYVGGNPYELNAATSITFHTHTSSTSTLGGTPKMHIDSAGLVGIGTTSPDTQLHLGAAVNVAPKLRLELVDSGNSINNGQEYGAIQWEGNDGQGSGVRAEIRVFGGGTSGETYMTFGTMPAGTSASANAIERTRITAGGSLLHGDSVTPYEPAWRGTAVFGISGADKIITGSLSSGTNGATIGGHNSALTEWAPLNIDGTEIRFNYQENRKMTMTSTGFGINTTTPNARLDVQGTAIIGTGTSGRANQGLTVLMNNATTYTANSDLGDGNRQLSIVNDNSTVNAYAALSFRVSPNTTTSMGDFKFVRTGASTSNLIWTTNDGGAFTDRFTFAGTGTFTASGDVYAYSDARVKENIETIDNALEKVMAMRGVSYNRTDTEDKTKKVGVIAQEIQKVLPEVVQDKEDGMLSVSYGNIVGVLIEAIKEQQKQIDELKELLNVSTK
jgi:hypothetical protein